MSNCDHCYKALSDCRFYLDRTVERFHYSNGELTQIQVLYSDSIQHFCSAGCADVSVPEVLDSLGLKILPPSISPVGTCAKCNGPVDMAVPHIAYSLMEATRISQPWLTHLEVYHDEYLCIVCQNCDGQLMEAEWQVVDRDEAALSEWVGHGDKETV